jgi:hypothetical protein
MSKTNKETVKSNSSRGNSAGRVFEADGNQPVPFGEGYQCSSTPD